MLSNPSELRPELSVFSHCSSCIWKLFINNLCMKLNCINCRVYHLNLLTAEFSFKNPLGAAQVKARNDEYTRRTQLTGEYFLKSIDSEIETERIEKLKS